MTTEARRELLLQRVRERTDALLEQTASTIQEALERYVAGEEERRREPRQQVGQGPKS